MKISCRRKKKCFKSFKKTETVRFLRYRNVRLCTVRIYEGLLYKFGWVTWDNKKKGNLNFKIYYGLRGTGFCSFYVKEHMELTVVRERGEDLLC